MGIKRCSKLHKAILASAVALFVMHTEAFAYADVDDEIYYIEELIRGLIYNYGAVLLIIFIILILLGKKHSVTGSQNPPVRRATVEHSETREWKAKPAATKTKNKTVNTGGWKWTNDISDVKLASGKETVAETDAEKRYFENLRTMQKSGLVTKAEYEEIVAKHEEHKEWQRR